MTHVKPFPALAASALLLLFSCGKAEDPNDFTQITERNAQLELSGDIDPTDWTLNEDWSDKEQKLFAKYDHYKHGKTPLEPAELFAYPNPLKGGGVPGLLLFNNQAMTAETDMDVRFVDKKFHVLAKYDKIHAYSTSFQLKPVVGDHRYVRMYYMLIRNDTCVAKGHGDIQLK